MLQEVGRLRDDPRDELAKATRDELWDYAKYLGKIDDMLRFLSIFKFEAGKGFIPTQREATQLVVTQDEMALWLRNMGFTQIKAAVRSMGKVVQPTQFGGVPSVPVVKPLPVLVPVEAMTIQELRAECKARGIKAERTDKKADLRAKLNG